MLQINAARSIAVAGELRALLQEGSVDILCVQEPYQLKGKVVGYRSGTIRLVQPESKTPWVTTMAAQAGVHLFRCGTGRDEHMVHVKVAAASGEIHLINVYCQYSKPIEPFLDRLREMIIGIKSVERDPSIVLVMDANAKSESWHAGQLDDRGRQLEEFIIENQLWVVNERTNVPTYEATVGESFIDVTIASGNMRRKISGWRVTREIVAGDHNAVRFEISDGANGERSRRVHTGIEGYRLPKGTWEVFHHAYRRNVTEQWKEELERQHPDEIARMYMRALEKVCQEGLKRRSAASTAVPWWTSDLRRRRDEVKRARKRLARTRGAANDEALLEQRKEEYRRVRNVYTKEIRTEKANSWKRFVTIEGNKDPWGLVHKIASGKMREQTVWGALRKEDGTMTANWRESANVLLKKMVPKDARINETARQQELRRAAAAYSGTGLEPPISEIELSMAIGTLKNRRAPGMDGITAEIVKQIWKEDKHTMLTVLNRVFLAEKFPKEWKNADIRVILKAADRDVMELGSYRPIALLPVLGKVLEKIICGRITEHYKERGAENPAQYGFRKEKSVDDALVALRNSVRGTTEKYVVVLFTDIVGAFDNLWWPAVMRRLIEVECSKTLVNIMRSYLSGRVAYIKLAAGGQTKRTMERGCPQGSVLGPSVWGWCMDALLNQLDARSEGGKVTPVAYADDLAVIIRGNSRNELESRAATVTREIEGWCGDHKLKIAPEKTYAMLMKGKLDRERRPKIVMGGTRIQYCEVTRYLGVQLDARMGFVEHLKRARDKVTNYAMTVRRMARDNWGLKNGVLTVMYKGAFLPALLHGAPVWYDAGNRTLLQRHVNAAQRVMLLSITGACRTASTVALQVLAGCMPVDLEAVKKGLMHRVRRKMYVRWRNYTYMPEEDDEESANELRDWDDDNDRAIADERESERLKTERERIEREVYEEWQSRWTEETRGRELFKYVTNVRYKIDNKWFAPNRKLVWLLTGYGPINESLHRRGASQTRECQVCQRRVTETVDHMIWDCEEYEDIRYGYLRQMRGRHDKLVDSKRALDELNKYAEQMFERRKRIAPR